MRNLVNYERDRWLTRDILSNNDEHEDNGNIQNHFETTHLGNSNEIRHDCKTFSPTLEINPKTIPITVSIHSYNSVTQYRDDRVYVQHVYENYVRLRAQLAAPQTHTTNVKSQPTLRYW